MQMIFFKVSTTNSCSILLSKHFSSLASLLKSGFTPTLKDFNRFLLFLSQTHKIRSVLEFIAQMNANRIKGNSQTHRIFTKALIKEERYEEAVQFLKTHLRKVKISDQSRIFSSLIEGLCIEEKDPEKAFRLLRDGLRIHGILPSSSSFCSLIHCFGCQGKMDKAIEVFKLMTDESTNYPFDNFVFTSVISGFIRIGKPELAVGFYENAKKSGASKPNLVICTAVLSAYCKLGRIEEACNLVSEMGQVGSSIRAIFYFNWICKYFDEGINGQTFQKHIEMVKQKVGLDAIDYKIDIHELAEANVKTAEGFIQWVEKRKLASNLITYMAIILGLCDRGKLEEAFMVFKIVQDLGITMDEFAFAILIDCACRRGNFDHTFKLFVEMEKMGIRPSVVTYKIIIDGLLNSERTSKANVVSRSIVGDTFSYCTLLHCCIHEANSSGISEMKCGAEAAVVYFDIVMCNTLIKALFMMGLFDNALEIYEKMPHMDLAADSVTYCAMIDGYCKAGRSREALEVFDEFRKTWGTENSYAACCSAIIQGLCRKGMIGMAIEMFKELVDRGFPSHEAVYGTLIKEIFRQNGAEGVLYLIHRLKTIRHDFFDAICNYAVCFMGNNRRTEAAHKGLLLMINKGSTITSKSHYLVLKLLICEGKIFSARLTLTTFIKRYGMSESRVAEILAHFLCMIDVNKAIIYLADMKKNSQNIILPTYLLNKLIKDGRALDAYKLLVGAESNLPLLNLIDYSTVIDGLCKAGSVDKALDICDLARNRGVTPNVVTYNSIIKGLCLQGSLVEAFRLFDSFEKIHMVPSTITFAILIDTLAKEGFLHDAKRLFEKMVEKNYKPNIRVYNSLINGYSKLGQIQEALDLLCDLETKGLKADEFTVSAVIDSYCRKGDMEGALGFFFEFKSKGISPDFLGFMYLTRGLCSKGRMEESQSILREMVQTQSVIDLLHRIQTDSETETVESFIAFLCDRGSIQEAVSILEEIASAFFPVGGVSATDHGTEMLEEQYERNIVGTSGTEFSSWLQNFESYCDYIGSLCSKGEHSKASKLVKLISASL